MQHSFKPDFPVSPTENSVKLFTSHGVVLLDRVNVQPLQLDHGLHVTLKRKQLAKPAVTKSTKSNIFSYYNCKRVPFSVIAEL